MTRELATLMTVLTACAPMGQVGPTGGPEADLDAGVGRGVRLQLGLRATGGSNGGTSTETASTGDTAGDTSTMSEPAVSLPSTDAAGNPLRIMAGTAIVRHIELNLPSGETCNELRKSFTFESPVRCGAGEDKIEIQGPFEVDLIGQTSEPSLDGLTLPGGTYKRVDIRFHRSSAPDEITLALSGMVDVGSEVIDFDLALGINEDARFESPIGVSVNSSGALLALIDADVVFGATQLGACAAASADDNGYASIDAESRCGDAIEDAIEDGPSKTVRHRTRTDR